MAVSFSIRLEGEPQRAFAAARARGQDLRPALRSVGQANVAHTRRRFITKRAPDGSSWKPTRKIGGSTLIASALLLRSISARPPTKTAVEVGSNRVYAAIHQVGGTIRAKAGGVLRFRVGGNGGWVAKREVTIPARPYLGASPADMGDYGEILLRHAAEPIAGPA